MSDRVRASLYHGESFDYLGSPKPDELGACEISFDLRGSLTARMELDRCSELAELAKHAPDGLGAFLAIDALDLGVPDIWLGAIPTTQLGGQAASKTLDATGPSLYLDEVPTGPVRESHRPAATIVRNAIQAALKSSTIANFTAAEEAMGRRAPYETSATTLWKLASDLADARLENFYITPLAGGVMSDMHWMTLDGGIDFSGEVTLIHGENCLAQPTGYGLRPKLADALVMAQSFGLGSEIMAAEVTAPDGSRPLGIHDALTMAVSVRSVRKLDGDHASPALPDLEQTAQEGVDLLAETHYRRQRIPKLLQQITVTDCSLWKYLRPNNRLRVQLNDDGGVFNDAIARIRTATFRVAPDLSCNLSVDLWRKI